MEEKGYFIDSADKGSKALKSCHHRNLSNYPTVISLRKLRSFAFDSEPWTPFLRKKGGGYIKESRRVNP
jgi:hypothetical protein